jgi:uncharacterized membrane protein YeaQ/YmgE (transglycosylase-associated protein family)
MSNKKYFLYVYFTRGILSGIYGSIRLFLDQGVKYSIFDVIKGALILSLPFLFMSTIAVLFVHKAIDSLKEGVGSFILYIFLTILMILRALGMGAEISFLSSLLESIIGAMIIIFIESKILRLEYRG